jgi:DNA-binding NarL/FixJ family response regulator
MKPHCDSDAGESGGGSASREANHRTLRVLLVDDHLLVRFRTRQQLQSIPALQVVGEATDGYEAIALARTLCPDLVFMDISMPGLDGLDATRRITAELPGVRVVILSSFDGETVRKSALAAGAHGYLVKGETTQRFAAVIDRVFGRQH